MNMQGKLFALLVGASCVTTLFGSATDVPVVSDVSFDQPGGGRTVTVTYNLQYAPAIVTMDVLTNGVSIGAENIVSFEGDVGKVVQPGTHQFKWFAKRDWPEHLITENIVSVKLRAWSLFSPPPYMVADLETASNVTYYVSADAIPGGVTNNLYKTSRIVMRRIDAVGVRWNMGAHKTEIGYQTYEGREVIHSAQLTNDYYIAIYPLTQGQWYKLINWYSPNRSSEIPGDSAQRDLYPLQWIAFAEMREQEPQSNANSSTTFSGNSAYYYPAPPAPNSYLGKLSSFTGVDFDLTSEGEWEFACRAGHYSGFWGDGSPISISSGADANLVRLGAYSKNTNSKFQPVGSYEPNSWGLYDMHGGIWELCLDWFAPDITQLDGAVNTNVNADLLHTERGGARHKDAQYCRSSYRDRDAGNKRFEYVGFRLVSRIAQ